MTNVKRILVLCLLAIVGVTPLLLAQSPYSPRAKEVGMHIKCLCKGCDMTAGGCAHPGGAFSGPCETAKAELREVDDYLAQGKSEQQVIDAFVQKYGTIAYVEPPKTGFGLVAWLMPIVYTIVGLAVVVFVVKKWASRKPAPVSADPATPGIPSDALARARAQAERDTED